MGISDLSKFELSIKFREPPPQQMGIVDFSKFELSIKFCKPLHPPYKWELWILANLNSASNSANPPPPPPPQMGIVDFSKFELSIKFCKPPSPK